MLCIASSTNWLAVLRVKRTLSRLAIVMLNLSSVQQLGCAHVCVMIYVSRSMEGGDEMGGNRSNLLYNLVGTKEMPAKLQTTFSAQISVHKYQQDRP